MLEFESSVLEVKFNGTVYKMEFPKKKHVMPLQKKLEAASASEKMELMIELLEHLGLPKEVIEELEMKHIEKLFTALTEKKS